MSETPPPSGYDPPCARDGCNGLSSTFSPLESVTRSSAECYLQILPFLQHLLCPNPIPYSQLWSIYKKAAASYWVVDYVDPRPDVYDYRRSLNIIEKDIIVYLIALLASTKGVHSTSIARYFTGGPELMETKYFFGIQMAMENTHLDCCSRFLWAFVKDSDEREQVFDVLSELPYVQNRTAWTKRWIDDTQSPYHVRLVAFACSQVLPYCGTFAILLWMEDRELLPSLARCNRLMAGDAGTLIRYVRELLPLLKKQPCQHIAEDAIVDAAEIEKRFLTLSLPISYIGLEEKDIALYIEHTADRLLECLGYQKKYKSPNPFPFAQFEPLQSNCDFFALQSPSQLGDTDRVGPPPTKSVLRPPSHQPRDEDLWDDCPATNIQKA
ncbi:ferritin-like protein [Auricularia subglabra TFB-10046 SS5]|uniref:Ferritin-like protein n=1 Tax=Auricularia subglabra (strain TFB-10046 / SS5) TaxID=717982 RepID=J0D3G0_AURST|nr:ferritin-like protein [Auricularia subglabra TFB-10046 SS5]